MIASIAVLFMLIPMSFNVMYDINDVSIFSDIAVSPAKGYFGFPVQIITDILMYLTAAVTLISGVKYLYDYREYIDPKK